MLLDKARIDVMLFSSKHFLCFVYFHTSVSVSKRGNDVIASFLILVGVTREK